ncbi:hypothetical protein [Mangrovibacterium sp.]|uniref:hypothetical protein n=1 Tax=Mangrovibacterium sp. TaxID=1961364 RepID=UPI00356385C0
MAKTKNIGGLQLSGKLGSLVFVTYGDETIVRIAPQKRKADSWSLKQKQHRQRFVGAVRHYKAYRATVVTPIWSCVATARQTAYNMFLKANMPAFNENGCVADPSLLRFSIGDLPLPQNFCAERCSDNPTQIDIRWDSTHVSQLASPTDQLMGIYYEPEGAAPFALNACRSDGYTTLNLPYSPGSAKISLFLFFRKANLSAYSPDKHFYL